MILIVGENHYWEESLAGPIHNNIINSWLVGWNQYWFNFSPWEETDILIKWSYKM